MAITQKDISAHLGIPHITVARALSGGRVSASTRNRVLEAAERLGYTPSSNLGARQLAARRYGKRLCSDIIAIQIPSLDDSPVRESAFFAPLLAAVELEAEKRRLDTFVCVARKRGVPPTILNAVDGLILLSSNPDNDNWLRSISLPVVTASFALGPYHAVHSDDRKGIDLVIEHLYSLGHRHIGYVGYPADAPVSTDRYEAYRDGTAARGLDSDPRFTALGIWTAESVDVAMMELLARSTQAGNRLPDFTALVCYNDHFAALAVAALERRGIRVPFDVSVTGYDATTLAGGSGPRITSVDFDRMAIGRIAVDILCRVRSTDGSAETADRIVARVPVTLRILETTTQPRTD